MVAVPPRPSRAPSVPTGSRLQLTGDQMRWVRSGRPNLAWLQGPGPSDLWVWTEPVGRTIELSFYGRTVLLRPSGVQTGICNHAESSPYARETGLVEFDLAPRRETLLAAIQLLEALPERIQNDVTQDFLGALRGALSALASDVP
jgi:hypothetical protein